MKQRHISEEDIKKILTDNPAAWLAFTKWLLNQDLEFAGNVLCNNKNWRSTTMLQWTVQLQFVQLQFVPSVCMKYFEY